MHNLKCHTLTRMRYIVGRGRVDNLRPEGRCFESRSSHHLETLDKAFTCSCPSNASACKLRHRANCCGRERLWKAHAV